ncbi:hypothetical protein J3F83DRAFT_589494 [Trichoderma novae-zelandiae]
MELELELEQEQIKRRDLFVRRPEASLFGHRRAATREDSIRASPLLFFAASERAAAAGWPADSGCHVIVISTWPKTVQALLEGRLSPVPRHQEPPAKSRKKLHLWRQFVLTVCLLLLLLIFLILLCFLCELDPGPAGQNAREAAQLVTLYQRHHARAMVMPRGLHPQLKLPTSASSPAPPAPRQQHQFHQGFPSRGTVPMRWLATIQVLD